MPRWIFHTTSRNVVMYERFRYCLCFDDLIGWLLLRFGIFVSKRTYERYILTAVFNRSATKWPRYIGVTFHFSPSRLFPRVFRLQNIFRGFFFRGCHSGPFSRQFGTAGKSSRPRYSVGFPLLLKNKMKCMYPYLSEHTVEMRRKFRGKNRKSLRKPAFSAELLMT